MLAALRLRAFRTLLAGRAFTAFGNSFAPVVLAFAVLDLTGSATDLGLVVGVRMLVNVLFLLFGGALADRLPRHLLMTGAAAAAAATQAGIAVLVLTGTASIPLLAVIAAVNGMVSAVSLPAAAAIVPQLVPEDLRLQANGLNRLAFHGAAVLGAPLGGIASAVVGPGRGLAANAACFLASAGCFALVRVPGANPVTRNRLLADLRAGWSEFVSRTWLWATVAGFCVLNAAYFGAVSVLGPAAADRTFGREGWGFVLAAQTVGMVVGAAVATRLRLVRLLRFGVTCVAGTALPILVLGVRPHLALLIPAALVGGVLHELFAVAWETTMQEHVPGEKLARVYSYDMVGSFLGMPLGQVTVGPLAESWGLRPTLVLLAGVMLLAVAGMLCSRDIRRLPHRSPAMALQE